MATVRDILSEKGTQIFSIHTAATVLDAAQLMNRHKIGALVVIEREKLAGIFTERDVLRRVVGEQRDPGNTPITDVMTTEVACCRLDTSIEEARSVMKNRRIRHLPVVDDQMRLEGIVSIGDLNAFHHNAQEVTIRFLHEYLYGTT